MKKIFLIIVLTMAIVALSACGNINNCMSPGMYGEGTITVIYNPGHSYCAQYDVVQALITDGFKVKVMYMPPKPHNNRPTSDFINPVSAVVNTESHVYMIGLSGGGWTTSVACALDARIEKCIAVAGSLPEDYPQSGRWTGDYEQQNLEYSYRDIYAMASPRLKHVYIWDDTCCFSRVMGDVGVPYVIDYTITGHYISPWTLDYIRQELKE